MKFGVVTEVSTVEVITVVFNKNHILIFSRYKYLYVKIDSLANVKSCVTVGMFGPVQFQWITSPATDCSLQVIVTVTVASSSPKASWVVVMYTMNNHTYNAMRV